jgi:Protein of unknown function (DUF4241)
MDQRRARALLLGIVGFAATVGVIVLFLVGPTPGSLSRPVAPVASEAMASLPPLLSTEEVYAAFAERGTAVSGGEPTVLSAVQAGDLVLPTGRVVAADVFFFNTEPFTRRLPAGRHPVLLLSSARDPAVAGDVAAAMIRAAPGDPVSWELATVPGQDPSILQPGEFFGYGVDSGTGCFASAEAVAVLTAGDFDEYSDQVHDGMFPSDDVADWKHSVDVVVDQASGANVIGFSSGFGDGGYPSWFGLDADGEPLVLLTDFGILEAPGP